MAAATQHGEEALLLQSTVMSANVVFINIDLGKERGIAQVDFHITCRPRIRQSMSSFAI